MDEVWLPLPEWLSMADWPFAGVLPESLNNLAVTQTVPNLNSADTEFKCLAPVELVLRVPGLDQVQLALGPAGFTEFVVTIRPEPFRLSLRVPVEIRVDANILRPLKPGTNEPDTAATTFDIHVGDVGLVINDEGNIDLDLQSVVTIPKCMVGTSGVILQIGKMKWLTPTTPPEQLPPNTIPGFTGLYLDDVIVEIPQLPAAVSAIRMDDVFLGTGGFSGKISQPNLALQWNGTDFTGAMHGELFGFKGGISAMSIEFRQNALVGSQIEGDVFIPYLNKRVGLTLGLDGAGSLTATAALPHSLPAETGVTPGSAGYLIHLDVGNILSLDIASIQFKAPAGNVPRLGIAGRVTPGTGVLSFPPIELTGLWIDARGRIQTEGDGIRLPSKYTLNFNGFQLEISKLGFGNKEDGGKWISFSGGLNLVAGMPAGASVEGLRITWYEDGRPIKISLNGVKVNFEIPNTLKFTGEVSYSSEQQQFRGAVKLDLIALRMQIDATAVFGRKDGKVYLAIYLAAEFPAGIPLFATGLGVYGMAGLFALNMEPNRAPGQEWYALGSTTDWYHSQPEVGVTRLEKWTPRTGSMAFGAGVTLGTVADNGHTFSGKMLLAIVFPGPILLIQGSASILQERTAVDKDANFRALAVLDGRAGTFQLGLDAKYRYDNNGALIDINGSAEAYFNFNDPNAWRLNVGLKEPRERRLTARLFKLFDSYSYVALNSNELAMGAWIGFKQQWKFGPLSVALEAWLDGNARVSWKPAHFYGDLHLYGSARLSAFGFGVGVTVDAQIAADVFDPFHLLGQFRVAIDLPWPFKDIEVNVKLEWGPQPTPPPLPLPLKEVAVEHFKATTSWPLARVARGATPPLLLPNYDRNNDGFFDPKTGNTVPADLNAAPVVPLDCRPHVTFARNVNDDALIGVNAQPVVPEFERIGDPVRNQGPARIRYGLKGVVLEKKKGNIWDGVAGKGRDELDRAINLPPLFGSWAPVPQMPGGGGRNVGQTKLWLWSKTPFEYTRRSSRAWDEWFSDEYTGYPCQTLMDPGWNFENIAPSELPNDWHHPDEPGLEIATFSGRLSIQALDRPSHGLTHAFGISGTDRNSILLPRPTDLVRILVTDSSLIRVSDFTGRDDEIGFFGATLGGTPDRPYIDIRGKNITRIQYFCEVFLPVTLASNIAAAVGGTYSPSLNRIIFAEFHGRLSAINLITNEHKILGTGYQNPEDVVVTADGRTAYVTERSGNLLKVDLTTATANRANATVVSTGMAEPQQMALDEAGGKAYVVEFSGQGRLLRIDLTGPTAGNQTVITSHLSQAVGLIVTSDLSAAYVSEQGAGGGQISRIDLATGTKQTVVSNLDGVFFLRWANAAQNAILTTQRGARTLIRIDLNKPREAPELIMNNLPALPSSVVILPNDRYVVLCDGELTIFSTTLLIPQIHDIGNDILVHHFEDEFARWSQVGEVLEPHTNYRLKVVTTIKARGEGQLARFSRDETMAEYAYFRTDGPPGVAKLTAPVGSEATPFVNVLDDLSRYVRKTMPIAAPVSSRLSYRAYDVGIEFDENYVDLMYRLEGRDLSIHLHDTNGAIVDDQGRRIVLANQWGRAEEVTLSDREERWQAVLGASGCTLIPRDSIVRNTTFSAPHEPHVLSPSSLCEARLAPALLHEDFGGYPANTGANGPGGSFERWQVRDEAGSSQSRWQINSEGTPADLVLAQTVPGARTTLVYKNASESLPDQPSNWTDFRLTVHLGFNDGKAGVVWRHRDNGQHYRFVMDPQAGKCELLLVSGATPPTSLATKPFAHTEAKRYEISVEAVKSSLRVYQDGKLVIDVTDATISSGTIGVLTAGTASARFTDIYVDDFRTTAPVVYRFSFPTSQFRNFADHMASFENRVRVAQLAPAANVAPLVAAAGLVLTPPGEAESRAYDALVKLLPGITAAPVVRATRVEQGASAIAFLIQSPEPLDWKRIDVQLLRGLTPVTSKVIRKADGAGLFIVSPAQNSAGSQLPQGDYRVVFTYRRNNRSFDPDSDVLSEAGVTTPEVATLDLPWPNSMQVVGVKPQKVTV